MAKHIIIEIIAGNSSRMKINESIQLKSKQLNKKTVIGICECACACACVVWRKLKPEKTTATTKVHTARMNAFDLINFSGFFLILCNHRLK